MIYARYFENGRDGLPRFPVLLYDVTDIITNVLVDEHDSYILPGSKASESMLNVRPSSFLVKNEKVFIGDILESTTKKFVLPIPSRCPMPARQKPATVSCELIVSDKKETYLISDNRYFKVRLGHEFLLSHLKTVISKVECTE
jgi:hypothetical protein